MSTLQWFRLYHRIIDDEKIRLIAFEDRWHFVAVCCLKADGLLDEPESDLKWRKVAVKLGVQLRELDEIKRRLSEVGLIDQDMQPTAWDKRQYQKPDLPFGETLSGFSGYVYFIAEKGADTVKIGYSKNPWARIKELQTGRPGKLSVVATVKTTEVSEQRVHDTFERERLSGEWFRLSGKISHVISEIKKKRLKTDSDVVDYANSYVATQITTTETDTDTDTDNSSLRSEYHDREEASGSSPAEAKNSKRDIEAEFNEQFWPVYPRKVSKPNGLKAYVSARKRASFAEIMAGLRRYAAERDGQDSQFTKYAQGWLSADGWADEPAAPVPRQGRNSSPTRRPNIVDAMNKILQETGEYPDEPELNPSHRGDVEFLPPVSGRSGNAVADFSSGAARRFR